MTRQRRSGRRPQRAHDAHQVTSELAEMLAVLVVPAMLLSGFSLLFG